MNGHEAGSLHLLRAACQSAAQLLTKTPVLLSEADADALRKTQEQLAQALQASHASAPGLLYQWQMTSLAWTRADAEPVETWISHTLGFTLYITPHEDEGWRIDAQRSSVDAIEEFEVEAHVGTLEDAKERARMWLEAHCADLFTPTLYCQTAMAPAKAERLARTIEQTCQGTETWVIANREKTGFCMQFHPSEYASPKRACETWLEDQRRHHPEHIEEHGYHAMPWIAHTQAERLALEAAKLLRQIPSEPEQEDSTADELAQPIHDLVNRFMQAARAKLLASEAKYGWNNAWLRTDWRELLVTHMHQHIAKGDPLDVAAYCMFAWHHGWPLATSVSKHQANDLLPLPMPNCFFADHRQPAYTAQQMRNYAVDVLASGSNHWRAAGVAICDELGMEADGDAPLRLVQLLADKQVQLTEVAHG
jgi:hypothetical protein